MFDRGSIVVVPFPYTDLKSGKLRPALVLSDRMHNDLTGDLVLCGLTSNLRNSAWSVLLEQRDLERGKLVATSRVKVDKLVTIHHSLVRKEVGLVGESAMAQVWKEFHSLFPR